MHIESGNKIITDFLKAHVYIGELLTEQISSFFFFFFNLVFNISNKYYKLGSSKSLFQDDMTSVCPPIYFEAQMYPRKSTSKIPPVHTKEDMTVLPCVFH